MNVAITGLGAVSACGLNVKETLINFSAGKRHAGKTTLFETELQSPLFEVKNFKVTEERYMRTVNFAFHALKEAMHDAELQDLSGLRIGVCLGTTVASQLNDIEFYRQYRENLKFSNAAVSKFLKSNLASAVAEKLNISAKYCCTVVNACSSGTDAVGLGLSWLKGGYCDLVIAGGADELSRIPFDGFNSLGLISNSLCAPFDKNRCGLNLGEGAGIVILEREDIADKRGVRRNLSLEGYGLSADAYHLTAPHPQGRGLESALRIALNASGADVKEVAFVNAHGTATKDNDRVEGIILKKIFGSKVKFISTKGFTGHTLGAAGALEAVFTCLGLRHGWIPASPGFINIDEEIGVSPLNTRSDIKGRYAISTSLAFGGNNSALVISRN